MINLKLKKNKKSQKGTTLIGVMISGSMLVAIGLASANMISNQSSSIIYLEDKLARIDFKREMITRFTDTDVCTNTISGLRVQTDQTITAIKDKDDNTIYSVNNSANNFDRLEISDIRLVNVSLPNSADASGEMKLRVFTARERSAGGPKDLAPFDVTIMAQTDSSGRLDSCAGVGTDGANPAARKCHTVPTGASGTPPFAEGTFLTSSTKNHICISSNWTEFPKTTTAPTTGAAAPSGPSRPACRGHMAYISGRLVCTDNQK